jgi:hypothetical protein
MHSTPAAPDQSAAANAIDIASSLLKACLPILRAAQNDDGGWGFTQGLESRVEPTAWCVLALHEFSESAGVDEAAVRGFSYLERTQLPDGSWPATAGQKQGSWTTASGSWALLAHREKAQERLTRGLNWLLHTTPGDAGRWWRFVRRLTAKRSVSSQSDQLYGWSWTKGTASWVEPTAYALIVLRCAPEKLLSNDARKRISIAQKMLLDRMCPGGGWNCGNPMVYGVAGQPQVIPTVWALLALRNSDTPEFRKSLDWLEVNRGKVQSLASLALTKIGLDALGRPDPKLGNSLLDRLRDKDISVVNIPAIAWAALAMSSKQKWLKLTMPDKIS